jgi:hypothetical protein
VQPLATTVQVRDGRVAALELPRNNLSGAIPRFGSAGHGGYQGGLDHLQKLDLSSNALGKRAVPRSVPWMVPLRALFQGVRVYI